MTPQQIGRLFSKSLFRKVEHVGISGGEPFVRKDLLDCIIEICEALPRLKSISIITNASIKDTDLQLEKIKNKLKKRKITLNTDVSLDGIGQIHDINRGVKVL